MYSINTLFGYEVDLHGACVVSFRKKPLIILDPQLFTFYETAPEAAKAIVHHENFHVKKNHYFYNLMFNLSSLLIELCATISVIYYFMQKDQLIMTLIFALLLMNKKFFAKYKYIPFFVAALFQGNWILFLIFCAQKIIVALNNQQNELAADNYAMKQIPNSQEMLKAFSKNHINNTLRNRLFGTHPSSRRRRANILKFF